MLPSLNAIQLTPSGYHQKATAKDKADDRANERVGHILKTLPKGSKINSILDIGAGNAEITDKIAKVLNSSTAMAVDQYKASEFVKLHNSIVTYGQVIDTNLPAATNSMDMVTAFMSIHHIKNIKKLLTEICRVLKPGGFLFFREHDVNDEYTAQKLDQVHLKYSQNPKEHSIEPTYYWGRRNLQDYLIEMGFQKIADSDYDYKNNPQNIYHSLYKSVDCKNKLLSIFVSDKSEIVKQSFALLQPSATFVNNWEEADVIWKPTAAGIADNPLPKLQYFNNLLTSAITEKGNLLQTGTAIFNQAFFDLTPLSFEFSQYNLPLLNGATQWLTQPAVGFAGKDTIIYNDQNALIKALSNGKRTIVQKYIDNPMLINQQRFKIRVYVLLNTNKVMIYTESYVKLADSSILLLNQTNISFEVLYDFMKQLKPLFDYALKVEREFKLQHNIKFNTFELLGVDLTFDVNGKPWLLNINKNPDVIPQISSVISDVIKETIFVGRTTKFIPLIVKEEFPYKKEFLNAEELWTNAVTLDLAQLKIINVPRGNKGWFSIPKEFKWEFQGQPVAIIVPKSAYDLVDKLVDYFSEEHRMRAQRKGCASPYDFYENNYNQVVTKALELQSKDMNGLPYRHWLREAVYMLIPECNAFKASVTKAFLKYIGSRAVLDPSAGWGDRLLGAAAGGINTYHGVDPNPLLRNAYDQMLNFIRQHGVGQNFFVITEDFLQINLGSNTYDTVFTSPPFFDYEIYVDDVKQSITGRNTIEDWTTQFLYPYLNKAWNALVPGGILALYISDTRSGKYVQNMYNYVNINLRGNFMGIIAVADENLGHAFPLWVWRKV